MTNILRPLAVFAACSMLALPSVAWAQTAAGIPPQISTPNRIETRLGTMEFEDGAPSPATVEKVYDNLDFTHALETFLNASKAPRPTRFAKGSSAQASRTIRS
jgi:hypothetical protein